MGGHGAGAGPRRGRIRSKSTSGPPECDSEIAGSEQEGAQRSQKRKTLRPKEANGTSGDGGIAQEPSSEPAEEIGNATVPATGQEAIYGNTEKPRYGSSRGQSRDMPIIDTIGEGNWGVIVGAGGFGTGGRAAVVGGKRRGRKATTLLGGLEAPPASKFRGGVFGANYLLRPTGQRKGGGRGGRGRVSGGRLSAHRKNLYTTKNGNRAREISPLDTSRAEVSLFAHIEKCLIQMSERSEIGARALESAISNLNTDD